MTHPDGEVTSVEVPKSVVETRDASTQAGNETGADETTLTSVDFAAWAGLAAAAIAVVVFVLLRLRRRAGS